MFGVRFARFVLRSSAISTRFSLVCFWPLAMRVKTNEFWMENIVKIGLVIQNNVTKHLQTCSRHGPAPESDERTCWSCLCFEENSNHWIFCPVNNKSKQQAMPSVKACIGHCKWARLHAFMVLEPLFWEPVSWNRLRPSTDHGNPCSNLFFQPYGLFFAFLTFYCLGLLQ